MGNRKFKNAQANASPRVQPPQGARVSTNDQKPIFNLEHLKGDYCLSKCSTEQKAAFVDRLWTLSKMTWGEIQRAQRHGLGHEEISRDSLGDRSYPAELSDDVPILAFRFMGFAPFLGYRIDRVFAVLIVDPAMTAYDHGP